MSTTEAKGMNGRLSFDGDYVEIKRTGLARLTNGKGTKRIPVAHITAVQWKDAGPMVNGFISFTLPGGRERESRFTAQTFDATMDENAVVFTRKQAPDFAAVRKAVEDAVAVRTAPAAPPSAAPSGADELGKLAALHASGALSDEEFAAAKARILNAG